MLRSIATISLLALFSSALVACSDSDSSTPPMGTGGNGGSTTTTPTSTGGADASTGGSGGGTSTDTPPPSGCVATSGAGDLTITDNWVTVGDAGGYAFAYVAPDTGDSNDCTGADALAGTSICVAGTVPMHATYKAVGGFGVNVNQPQGTGAGEPTAGTWSGTVATVTVGYSNAGGSTLRIQVEGTGGTYYCVDTTDYASGTAIPAADFNSACWDGSGEDWDGAGLKSVQLIVPSKNTSDTVFNACLTSLAIANQ